jgi:hypothetical protein
MLLSQSKAIILGAGLLVIGLISGSGAYAANDSAGDVVLDCTFTKYKNTGYSVKLAKSWIPNVRRTGLAAIKLHMRPKRASHKQHSKSATKSGWNGPI